jgi:hypothetical protein
MTVRIPKFCAITVLAVALVYSGVAWATCLRDGHSHDSAVENNHEQGHGHDHAGSKNQHDSQEPSAPIIHCTSFFNHVGPGVVVTSFHLESSGKLVALHGALIPEAVSQEARNNLWLNSLFRRILTFSFSFGRTRHLFLSVLQV